MNWPGDSLARCCGWWNSRLYDLDGMLMGTANQYLDFTTSAPVVARVLTRLRSLYQRSCPGTSEALPPRRTQTVLSES